jgi:hypothetical protein
VTVRASAVADGEVDERLLTSTGLEARDRHHPVRNGTSMAEAQVQLVNLAPVHSGYLALCLRVGRIRAGEGAKLPRLVEGP